MYAVEFRKFTRNLSQKDTFPLFLQCKAKVDSEVIERWGPLISGSHWWIHTSKMKQVINIISKEDSWIGTQDWRHNCHNCQVKLQVIEL